jgi:DNA-binding transcriptional LysR family regulator
MDLKQIEHFIAVAEERHFTRAARRLNVVQSGLSATIRALEEDLGGPLFIRSTRHVELTPAGQVLLEEGRRVILAARNAKLAVTEVHNLSRGRLTIGTIQNLAPFADLPASLGQFRRAFGGIDVELLFDGAGALLEQVAEGRLDLVFTQASEVMPDGVTARMFACEGLVVVCTPSHPLAGSKDVPLSRVCREVMIALKADWAMRRLVDRCVAQAGLQRRIGFEVNDMPMLLELAAQGLGVALVPETVASERMRNPRGAPISVASLLTSDEPCWELVAAFRGQDEEPADPVVRAYLEFLALPDPPL